MTADPVIEVRDVSKGYNVYKKMSDVLKEGLFGGIRHDVFWALRDVSFTVREGERVGVIGPNGAGKSTLLKLITGNLTPTSGDIRVTGKISALLNLVPALRMDESGLENIRLNLLMSGAKRSQLPLLIDDIIDFAELASFIYQPVRTYSSGMMARLAFAVATSVTPEILIVDEVLGAGDAYFQAKAEKRMRDLCARGRALLFVSHSTPAILNLCQRVIWIENGSIRLDADARYGVQQYVEDTKRQEDLALRSGNMTKARGDGTLQDTGSFELFEPEILNLRIVPADSARFHSTHYVTDIKVGVDEGEIMGVPLEHSAMGDSRPHAVLGLLGTEWGRLHSRFGRDCRSLSAQNGRLRGGLIAVRHGLSQTFESDSAGVRVEFESQCDNDEEELSVEYLDLTDGAWRSMQLEGRDRMPGHWRRQRFACKVGKIDRQHAKRVEIEYLEKNKADLEIEDVSLIVDGASIASMPEGQPFQVVVRLAVRRPVRCADVSIQFTRTDGVHVFWQSSAIGQDNYYDVAEDFKVSFDFGNNFLGFGSYYLSAFATNGWDPVNNFPYSEVYDRKVHVHQFTVLRGPTLVDRGLINQTVPVRRLTMDENSPDQYVATARERLTGDVRKDDSDPLPALAVSGSAPGTKH